MRDARRKHCRLAGLNADGPAPNDTAQDPRGHVAFLALDEMNMQWRAVTLRWYLAFNFQHGLVPMSDTTQTQGLARVTVFQSELVRHHVPETLCARNGSGSPAGRAYARPVVNDTEGLLDSPRHSQRRLTGQAGDLCSYLVQSFSGGDVEGFHI